MVSGVDLLAHSQESLEKELVEKIPDVAEITHVYYFAYKAGMDVKKEIDEALEMFSKAVKAVDKLCPALEFIVLQIGTKICKSYILTNYRAGHRLTWQMVVISAPTSLGMSRRFPLARRLLLFPRLPSPNQPRLYPAHMPRTYFTTRR